MERQSSNEQEIDRQRAFILSSGNDSSPLADDQPVGLNRVTIPAITSSSENRECGDMGLGEDTEHELSLSRQDDSDMSEEESISNQAQSPMQLMENEEAKNDPMQELA